MAQSDQVVQNATFPTVRADINDNLAALYTKALGLLILQRLAFKLLHFSPGLIQVAARQFGKSATLQIPLGLRLVF